MSEYVVGEDFNTDPEILKSRQKFLEYTSTMSVGVYVLYMNKIGITSIEEIPKE